MYKRNCAVQTNGLDVIYQHVQKRKDGPVYMTKRKAAEVAAFHESLPTYQQTRLVSLQNLANYLGVKGIYVKDESGRFGLKAFKGLGGIYAMFQVLCKKLGLNPQRTTFSDFQGEAIKKQVADIIFVTATDGNHGKGISWAAGLFGCQAYVFMPVGAAKEREEAIRKVGPAIVQVTTKNYDETVNYAKEMSKQNGWILIQDTSWDGYEQIPIWIIQGYLTMAAEAVEQIKEYAVKPTHVFLQAGVGAMAGGICGYLMNYYAEARPIVSVVEPASAACIFYSAQKADGKIHSLEGNPHTIMAGLNCGTPCKVTWPILQEFISSYFSCPDYVSAYGIRTYARPMAGDAAVVSGESGAVTLGLVRMLLENVACQEIKTKLELNSESVLLLFNTEGDTDPYNYRKIVENELYPIPE